MLLLLKLVAAEFAFEATFDHGLAPFKPSTNSKYSGAYEVEQNLFLKDANRFYGLGAPASAQVPFSFQYEVQLTEGLTCGGAYVKLLEEYPEDFDDQTPYVIMFGPDKCGTTDKVHFILRYKGVEHHLDGPKIANDKNLHLYGFTLEGNALELFIDGESKFKGSLGDLSGWPTLEIDDPEDLKPEDWVDTPKIDDPDAVKPDDWDEDAPLTIPDMDAMKPSGWLDDEPAEIPDPEAAKPQDWDDEEDGEWEPPTITNPKCTIGCGEWQRPTKKNPDYKGKWVPAKIDNPEYKGVWSPKQIPNPDYFEVKDITIQPIAAVAVEIWTTNAGILMDNFALGSKEDCAEAAKEFFAKKEKEQEEAKQKKIEKDKKKLEKKLKKGNLLAKLQVFINEFFKQPVAAVATLASVFVALFLFSVAKRKRPVAPPAAEPAAEEKDDDPPAEEKDDDKPPRDD